MKRVCAWCGKFMGYRKGGNRGDITHGLCRQCYNRMKADQTDKGIDTGDDKRLI